MKQSRKICLLGASGAGKTSLVKRFVEAKFDETYRTTIGVHIDKKQVICNDEHVDLVIWDLEGKDDPQLESRDASYLKGAQGYMFVADVTRPYTLDVAKGLFSAIVDYRKEERVRKEGILAESFGEDHPPFVLLLNKQDLPHASSVTKQAKNSFGNDVTLFKTSAKLDEGVEQAFNCLVSQMLDVDKQESSGSHSLTTEDPNQLEPSNDSERTSPGECSKATEPSTLSFDERALFDSLFRALDSLILERSTEGDTFRPIHEVPEWAHNLIAMLPDQPNPGLWVVQSHFLKDYVSGAMSWWDQHEGGESPSVPWEEDGPCESGLDLDATATAIGHRKLLVIKRGAPSRRAYIQLMRKKRLKLLHRSSEL